jgi:hypothetical protein
VGGRHHAAIATPDQHALADLVIGGLGQIFTGFVLFLTRVALPLFPNEFDIDPPPTGLSVPRAYSIFWWA